MELNDALKETISKYGIEIIKNKQYVNILDDLGSFRNESTPLKKIMKGLLDSGFSDLLCQHHRINDTVWYNEVQKCVSDYKINSGYREDLINRLVEAFFSLPDFSNVSKPYNNHDVKYDEEAKHDPNNYKNDNWNYPQWISTDANTTLNTKTTPNSKNPNQNKPTKSGGNSIPTRKQGNIATNTINSKSWKIIKSILHSNGFKITIVGILFLPALILSYSYYSSSKARNIYNSTINLANIELNKGNNRRALELYQKAANDYDASYSNFTLKHEAYTKAGKVSEIIFNDWKKEVNNLLVKNEILKAMVLTEDLPQNLVLTPFYKKEFNEISDSINNEFKRIQSAVLDEILYDIYRNQGKMSPIAKEQLSLLIKCEPDNYWYNLLFNK